MVDGVASVDNTLPPTADDTLPPAAAAAPPSVAYHPLVIVATAAAAGIVIDRIGLVSHAAGPSVAVLWWVVSAALLGGWLYLRRCRANRAAGILLLLAISSTGATWHHLRWHCFDRDEISRFAISTGHPTCIKAMATERPVRLPAPPSSAYRAIPQGDRSQVALEVLAVRDGTTWSPAAGNCNAVVDGHVLNVAPGDQVQVFGNLRSPRPVMNPGQFDFGKLARSERTMARVLGSSPDCVSLLKQTGGGGTNSILDRWRHTAEQMVRKHVSDQHAPAAAAILLGRRDSLDRDATLHYLLTGTIHVLVVSGLHVGILAGGLFLAMRSGVVSRRRSLLAVIAMVLGYALLTGAQPPVVRATVLLTFGCLAGWHGRRVASMNSLGGAALVVLAMNPADLFRTGPQLSFLAVAALIWTGELAAKIRAEAEQDPLDRLIASSRPWFSRLWRSVLVYNGWLVAATCAVWLVTLPLVVLRFHVAAPIAVFLSPLVWLCISGALYCGFAMLTLGSLSSLLANTFGGWCEVSLGALDWLVRAASEMPGGHVWLAGPDTWWVVGCFVGLFGSRLFTLHFFPPRHRVAFAAVWILAGILPALVERASPEPLRCEFLSLGHGGCVVIECPTGETILYDAGALSSPEFATQTVAGYLWHRGVARIDAIILSHADVDHFNAVPGLMERFHVGQVLISPMMFDGFAESAIEFSAPAQFEQLLKEHTAVVETVQAGDSFMLGPSVRAEVLHPHAMGFLASDNANSVTLAIEYAGRRILLPGDLESPGIEAVLAELPYDCDVLMAPHHGSRRSDPPGFAAWCTPEWVVISGSGRDPIDEVISTYESAGATVLRTDRHGAIEVTIGEDGAIDVVSRLQSGNNP